MNIKTINYRVRYIEEMPKPKDEKKPRSFLRTTTASINYMNNLIMLQIGNDNWMIPNDNIKSEDTLIDMLQAQLYKSNPRIKTMSLTLYIKPKPVINDLPF